MHLLAIITLVASAISFGSLLFSLIELKFPDQAVDYFYNSRSVYEGSIRWAIAMLVVMFPVFFFVARFLRRDVARHPEKKEFAIRKWLIYLTLFGAALVVIGDLVAILNSFLQGELTLRFGLKALTVLFIAGSIFYYYFAQIKEKVVKYDEIFSWFIIGVVVAGLVWGFAVIGGPATQRAKRFDERRVTDLQTIQNYILNYWQSKQTIPGQLSELEDSISGFRVPVDPETGDAYEYIRGSVDSAGASYQLCATFNRSDMIVSGQNQPIPPGYYELNSNWQHEAGRYCFDRMIDADLYPSLKQ